jgi:hypothetical protein
VVSSSLCLRLRSVFLRDDDDDARVSIGPDLDPHIHLFVQIQIQITRSVRFLTCLFCACACVCLCVWVWGVGRTACQEGVGRGPECNEDCTRRTRPVEPPRSEHMGLGLDKRSRTRSRFRQGKRSWCGGFAALICDLDLASRD